MNRVASSPMNPQAVQAANARVPDATTAAQKEAWMDAYASAGGKVEVKSKPTDQVSPAQQAKLKQSNQAACRNGSGGSQDTAAKCTATPCSTKTLVIKDGSNPKRAYQLSIDIKDPKKNPQGNRIQMIGDWDQNPASAKFIFSQCGEKPTAFSVKGGEIKETVNANNHQVSLYGKAPANDLATHTLVPLSIFFEDYLWPTSVQPNTYTVQSTGCSTHRPMSANVEVFTPLSWSGELAFEFKNENASIDLQYTPKKKRRFETVFSIKGKAEITYGTRKWSIEPKFDKTTATKLRSKGASGLAKKLFNITEDLEFLRNLDDYSKGKLKLPKTFPRPSVKCSINWPSLKIGGGAKNVVSEKTWKVGAEYDFSLSGNLISARLSGDVLDFLAYLYCPALFKIKQIAAEDLKGDPYSMAIILMLEISADANSSYEAKFTTNDDKMQVKGTLKAQGGFGIKAELSAEGRAKVWRWEAYAGAGAVGQLMSDENNSTSSGLFGEVSPVVLSDTEGFDWSGKVGFNGLAFYYAIYAYAGVRDADSKHFENKSSRRQSGSKKTSTAGGTEHKTEASGKITLIKPWTYPDN